MSSETEPEKKGSRFGPTGRDAEQFVGEFRRFWENPRVDSMGELLTPDVLLVQPLARPMRGLEQAQQEFRRIFQLIPDLRGEVDRWSESNPYVFIDFRLSGSIGTRRVEWPVIDRFWIEDGMARERISYFDPTRLVATLAVSPRGWPRFVRSGIWKNWLGFR